MSDLTKLEFGDGGHEATEEEFEALVIEPAAQQELARASDEIRAKVVAGTILTLLRDRIVPAVLADGGELADAGLVFCTPLAKAARAIVDDRPAEARTLLTATAPHEHHLPSTLRAFYEALHEVLRHA